MIKVGGSSAIVVPFQIIKEIKEGLNENETLYGFDISNFMPVIKSKE